MWNSRQNQEIKLEINNPTGIPVTTFFLLFCGTAPSVVAQGFVQRFSSAFA
jgi:hypothetical protein